MDTISKERRSWNMSRIRDKNTRPEIIVRSLLHRMGYRFSLGSKSLPGKPDIVLPKYKTAVFVHGCFWHGHNCRRGKRIPKTNTDYWLAKINKNKSRDKAVRGKIRSLGWSVLTLWECQLSRYEFVKRKLLQIALR